VKKAERGEEELKTDKPPGHWGENKLMNTSIRRTRKCPRLPRRTRRIKSAQGRKDLEG